jgi:hypothetical protein
MNNPELDSILKKARTPEPSKESLEMLPCQIISRLNRERESRSSSFSLSGRGDVAAVTLKRGRQRWFPRLAWRFAATICILAAFAIGHWRGRMETKTVLSGDVLADSKVVGETLAMFPNQVRAIVQDGRGLKLVLADSADLPVSTPIYVRVCDGVHCSSLVTFSGQEIQIGGQKITVLSDAHGGIILMGNNFAWSSREPSYAKSDLKIMAKNLGPVTM